MYCALNQLLIDNIFVKPLIKLFKKSSSKVISKALIILIPHEKRKSSSRLNRLYCGRVFGTEMVLLTFITDVIQILKLFMHFGVLANISFFLIWFSYYTLLLVQAKNERELNDCKVNTADKNCISEIGLTPRELEVAAYILKGETYNDLAERMYISHKTVSKHASNIFKKAECCNREEFLLKYLKV
ncbi:response regulator transcription factor [Crocinitomix algicola]|uniref:response regulator transcription factor n=1 Tax=Crocinitomix algicola TaxID=1740263 RepID=UPI00082E7399|nr:helix-turn-helix transcriptional regulator [Crocinitomix algicola]